MTLSQPSKRTARSSSKTERIVDLLVQGKLQPKQIAERVGSTHSYVCNVRVQLEEQREIDRLREENATLRRLLSRQSRRRPLSEHATANTGLS